MADILQRLQVEVTGDTSHAERKLDDLSDESKGGKWAKKLAVAGAAAFAGVGVAAGAFAFKAIQGASDVAEQVSKVNTVFGESAGIVHGFADRMAKDFGTPKVAMLESASAIGLIGKASGLAQGEAATLGTNMAKLATDASSFYNVPLEEALTAIRSGLVGEAEPMRRFGVLLNEAAVQSEAVRLGLAAQGQELTEGMKAQARASLIMRGMTDASGDLERTQGSLANRLREVQGRAMNFASDVGARLIPIVLDAMDGAQKFAAVVGPVLGDAFKQIGPVLEGVVEAVRGFVEDNGPMLLDFGMAVGNVIGALATTVFPLLADAVGFVAPILGNLAQFIIPALTTALNVVAPIISGMGDFIQRWQTPLTVVAALIGATMIPKLIAWATQAAATGAVNAFWWAAGKADAAASAAAQVVAGARVIAGWVAQGIAALAGAAQVAAAWLISVGPVALVIAAVVGLVYAIVRNWDTIKEAVAAGARWVGDRLGDVAGFFSELPGMIGRVVSGAVGWLVNTGKSIITGLINGFTSMLGTLWDRIRSIPQGLWTVLGNAGDWLLQTGKNIIIGLWNGIVGMGQWLYDKLVSLVKNIIPGPVKWALGISSPSKVMAGLGREVGAGLAQGILASSGVVADAARSLTAFVPDALDIGASVGASGVRPSSTVLGGAGAPAGGVVVHAPITITEVAPGEGEAVASELVSKLSRVRMRG